MINLKKYLKAITVASAFMLGSLSYAANVDMNADENDLAIKGYDTVAYFQAGKAVKGSTKYSATYNNAIYQFSSADNRDAFRANPKKFAPQFGGHCAYGVTKEKKFDTDPLAWRIVDGKLYLNLNKKVQQVWFKDIPGNLATAYQIWPDIRDVPSADL